MVFYHRKMNYAKIRSLILINNTDSLYNEVVALLRTNKCFVKQFELFRKQGQLLKGEIASLKLEIKSIINSSSKLQIKKPHPFYQIFLKNIILFKKISKDRDRLMTKSDELVQKIKTLNERRDVLIREIFTLQEARTTQTERNL